MEMSSQMIEALKAVLAHSGCRCDTGVCYWCRTDGWVQVSPETIKAVREALSAATGVKEKMFRVCWRDDSGENLHSLVYVNEGTAKSTCEYMNKRYPDNPHWVEPAS